MASALARGHCRQGAPGGAAGAKNRPVLKQKLRRLLPHLWGGSAVSPGAGDPALSARAARLAGEEREAESPARRRLSGELEAPNRDTPRIIAPAGDSAVAKSFMKTCRGSAIRLCDGRCRTAMAKVAAIPAPMRSCESGEDEQGTRAPAQGRQDRRAENHAGQYLLQLPQPQELPRRRQMHVVASATDCQCRAPAPVRMRIGEAPGLAARVSQSPKAGRRTKEKTR